MLPIIGNNIDYILHMIFIKKINTFIVTEISILLLIAGLLLRMTQKKIIYLNKPFKLSLLQ